MTPANVERAFTEGEVYRVNSIEFHDGVWCHHPQGVLKLHTVANLIVRSGTVVVCDPYTPFDLDWVAIPVRPGVYPIILSLVHTSRVRDLAYATLQVTNAAVYTWDLLGEYITSYVRGSFMDVTVADLLGAKSDSDPHYEKYVDELVVEQLDRNSVGSFAWADVRMGEDVDANLVIFTEATGTGSFCVFGGYDDEGNLARIVIDYKRIVEDNQD